MSIKKASTLIISSSLETKLNNFDYNVLLLKRSKNMKSWPGLHVFPGGKLDEPYDTTYKWLDVFFDAKKTVTIKSEPTLLRRLFKGFINENSIGNSLEYNNNQRTFQLPNELSYRLCAIRETFEETGKFLNKRK